MKEGTQMHNKYLMPNVLKTHKTKSINFDKEKLTFGAKLFNYK